MAAALAQYSLHPVSRALLAASQQGVAISWTARGVQEVAGAGVRGWVINRENAPKETEIRLGSAEFCEIEVAPSEFLQAHLSDSDGWLATFELHEDLRPDAKPTVAALQRNGIKVHLLSGDGVQAAGRVAAQVGITEFRGLCSPLDKLEFLRLAQQRGQRVAVVGDGLNDGPVLAGAHVSFAFGRAAPLAQAQADFVVLGEQIAAIETSFQVSRRTLLVVRQNLWWAAIYNAVCVPLAIVGLLPAWLAGLGMALSSLLVVLNALRLSKIAA
jgi:Cu2+-exporting ATPase